MKLNQRDKIILIGVLVVLIWVLGVVFFIKPAISAVSSASQTLDSKEMELSSLKAQIKEDENLPQEVDEAYDKATELADVFYDKMQQYAVATEVQSQLDNNNIKNLNLTISAVSSTTLNKYSYNDTSEMTAIDNMVNSATAAASEDAVAADESTIIADTQVSNCTISFSFECTKGDLLKFIQNIQTNSQRSLVISSLAIADVQENTDSTKITGSMTLDFMMVPNLPNPEDVDNSAGAAAETVDATEE